MLKVGKGQTVQVNGLAISRYVRSALRKERVAEARACKKLTGKARAIYRLLAAKGPIAAATRRRHSPRCGRCFGVAHGLSAGAADGCGYGQGGSKTRGRGESAGGLCNRPRGPRPPQEAQGRGLEVGQFGPPAPDTSWGDWLPAVKLYTGQAEAKHQPHQTGGFLAIGDFPPFRVGQGLGGARGLPREPRTCVGRHPPFTVCCKANGRWTTGHRACLPRLWSPY